MWDHLVYHLVAAGRFAELVATLKDLRYLANKTLASIAYAAEADLAFAEQRVPDDVPLRLLMRNFANMSHLLNLCTTYNDIAAVLLSRLVHLKDLSDTCARCSSRVFRHLTWYAGTCSKTCQTRH